MTPRRTDDLRIRAKRLFDFLKAARYDDGGRLFTMEDKYLLDEVLEALEPGVERNEELVNKVRRLEAIIQGFEGRVLTLERGSERMIEAFQRAKAARDGEE